jgi:hypothetical protein
MSNDADEVRAELSRLLREVEGLKQLVCLTELSGPGLRFIVRNDRRVLQYFNNAEWVDVPVVISPF